MNIISISIVVLNGDNYFISDPIKALETCFKCLIALRSFPYLCDHLWYFIGKYVYGLQSLKSYEAVTKFIVELNKIEIENKSKTVHNVEINRSEVLVEPLLLETEIPM